MASIAFAENLYAFRRTEPIFGTIFVPSSPSETALAAIEQKLIQAHNDYLGRRYQDAISAYKEAQALIYAQLDPGFPFNPNARFSLDPVLFAPLLSSSLEWMNALPVRGPLSPVRPRVPVDQTKLGDAAKLDQVGLVGSQFTSPAAQGAVADWQTAKSYEAAGNTSAAKFFLDRATASQPTLVANLERAQAPAGGIPAVGGGAPIGAGPAGGIGPVAGGPIGIHAIAAAPISAPIGRLMTNVGELRLATTAPIAPPTAVPVALTFDRTYGMVQAGNVVTFGWKAGEAPPQDQVQAAIYQKRVTLVDLPDIIRKPTQPGDIAIGLPHDYYYTIPLGLAECYHALGDYASAETAYFQAAGYQFLNTAVEAPYLWLRLATLYLDWGNTLFRGDNAPAAITQYQNVLLPGGGAPSSLLYTTTALKPGADVARTVIANLANAANLNVNPLIAAVVVEVFQQLTKIQNGLDFWGIWHNSVPIWTFDYLQSVAINFAQLAVSAERDLINFLDRADQASLTRQQIVQSLDQANAETQAARLQAQAASTEAAAYGAAVGVAQQRAADATANANEYASKSAAWIVHQAQSTQLSGGDDGDAGQLNSLADQMMSGSYSLSDGRATLAGAEQLTGARLNREYEVDALKRQSTEMNLAVGQAQAELAAANARAAAANAAVTIAQLRASAAQQNLAAFDDQTFTPDVWYRMGDAMRRLYNRYFTMALKVARTMQQAYNFETDQTLQLIKGDYSTDEVKGLLGADALMADIQSFTYNLISSQSSKPQPVRQTISLANRYPFLFESQLRSTGKMSFETRIDDFDLIYPGTYAGRIEAVEVEVQGIVPVTGISGTLTNSGISAYRTPSSLWTNPASNGLKYRVQSKETLVLSDYAARQDTLLIQNDQRMMRVFEGAGLASTWELDLPPAINDLDYGALTDVRITLYYKARFDPSLRDRVEADLATRPGLNARQRGIPLRWIYPDAFFHFQDTGALSITLKAADFRTNETKPILTNVGVLVVTDGSVPAAGLKLSLGTPANAAVVGTTDASGIIGSDTLPAWAPLAQGSALGTYTVSVSAADNPALVKDGQLNLAPIVNLALNLGYSYTPRA